MYDVPCLPNALTGTDHLGPVGLFVRYLAGDDTETRARMEMQANPAARVESCLTYA
jgi:hypothetical protein